MLKGCRVLIVEREFLIALDIQRILESAETAQTIFARNSGEAMNIEDRWHDFDLAVIEPPREDAIALALLAGLQRSGVAIVVSTADGAYRHGVPEVPDAIAVIKPFGETELVAACTAALIGRPRR